MSLEFQSNLFSFRRQKLLQILEKSSLIPAIVSGLRSSFVGQPVCQVAVSGQLNPPKD